MKNQTAEQSTQPAILAPAGNRASFLAAVAAGADAIYCGLKQFSARMEAHNFTLKELVALTELAHEKGSRVYVAFNTLLKTGELEEAGRLLDLLCRQVKPDAIILQDLAMIDLVRRVGYRGQINLSTLANISSPAAIKWVGENLDVDRVVIPRELSVDEIKAMAAACPPRLELEAFIHGALCYGVSGRCYWSSFLGGKSGLRGLCVQPCRRNYRVKDISRRFFSCQDLSLDVLVKVLMTIPKVRSWKIEGRKKGPHYVFYTVQAYRLLRDHGRDPQAKRAALELLELSLGRKGTHYRFLPQRPQNPLNAKEDTASGLFIGTVQGGREPYLSPRLELLKDDLLRIGYEDQPWHAIHRIGRSVPSKGRLHLNLPKGKTLRKGTPVFLIDRREQALASMLNDLEAAFKKRLSENPFPSSRFQLRMPAVTGRKGSARLLRISRNPDRKGEKGRTGRWLSVESVSDLSGRNAADCWWVFPPVIWPSEEEGIVKALSEVLQQGARHFILNDPFQRAFFEGRRDCILWAGPFCNLSNPLAVSVLADHGFDGAIVSPELGREDYLAMPSLSPVPLGIVLYAGWPLCISRVVAEDLPLESPFSSPKGEDAWVSKYGENYWVFPNWRLDIRSQKTELVRAGYRMFVELEEPVPEGIALKKRPGLWNWDLKLS